MDVITFVSWKKEFNYLMPLRKISFLNHYLIFILNWSKFTHLLFGGYHGKCEASSIIPPGWAGPQETLCMLGTPGRDDAETERGRGEGRCASLAYMHKAEKEGGREKKRERESWLLLTSRVCGSVGLWNMTRGVS